MRNFISGLLVGLCIAGIIGISVWVHITDKYELWDKTEAQQLLENIKQTGVHLKNIDEKAKKIESRLLAQSSKPTPVSGVGGLVEDTYTAVMTNPDKSGKSPTNDYMIRGPLTNSYSGYTYTRPTTASAQLLDLVTRTAAVIEMSNEKPTSPDGVAKELIRDTPETYDLLRFPTKVYLNPDMSVWSTQQAGILAKERTKSVAILVRPFGKQHETIVVWGDRAVVVNLGDSTAEDAFKMVGWTAEPISTKFVDNSVSPGSPASP